jgi:cytochrome bd-type quinol oxidase subunit 1/mono/diheme cytochrome c family protein
MVFEYYPFNDYDPLIKGMAIGGLGIFHVFTAQFAIGGGFLMCYFQWLARHNRLPAARRFLDSYFTFLVLVSFVIGALTGVAMWFTSIQVSPRTIGVMIDEFHWVWATEWTFFCVEIVAGYAFYRYSARLTDRSRMRLLGLYAFAAWMSLFWINGILSWQLTPGGWVESRGVWAGFFNSSFWPSLLYRSVASLAIASLVGCVVINAMRDLDRTSRTNLINASARLLWPMVLMPVLGAWYLAVLPTDSRTYVLGGSVAMTMFMGLTVATSCLIGGYALIGLIKQRLYINGATATLLCVLAFAATGGGEFIREGVRKPFTIREYLYSNSITTDQVALLREQGCVTEDFYPLRDAELYPNEQLVRGGKVFRFLCSVCHTVSDMNGLTHLTGTWTTEQKRMNIAKLQRTKPFMPPFAGTAAELEALVQFIEWNNADRPEEWPDSGEAAGYVEQIKRIEQWIRVAGEAPGFESETAPLAEAGKGG